MGQSLPGLTMAFERKLGGFTRAPGSVGYSFAGPAMFFISKRFLRPGVREEYGKKLQHVTDMWWASAPGLVATMEIPAADHPDAIWSLRIFTDYTQGFLAHIFGDFGLIAPTLAMTLLPMFGS